MFVGSSSNNRSGLKVSKIINNKFSKLVFLYLEKRALAKANLILQPPENVFVGCFCISEVKPRPFKIIDALAGALSASIFCSWA